MLANLGHFHLYILICSICFNDVIFSSALPLPGPHKLTKREKTQIKLHNSHIIPIKHHTPSYVFPRSQGRCWRVASVSAESFHTNLLWPHSCVTRNSQMDMYDITQYVCHTYVCVGGNWEVTHGVRGCILALGGQISGLRLNISSNVPH